MRIYCMLYQHWLKRIWKNDLLTLLWRQYFLGETVWGGISQRHLKCSSFLYLMFYVLLVWCSQHERLSCVAHPFQHCDTIAPGRKAPMLDIVWSWPICFQYRWTIPQSVNSFSTCSVLIFFLREKRTNHNVLFSVFVQQSSWLLYVLLC